MPAADGFCLFPTNALCQLGVFPPMGTHKAPTCRLGKLWQPHPSEWLAFAIVFPLPFVRLLKTDCDQILRSGCDVS